MIELWVPRKGIELWVPRKGSSGNKLKLKD
jgi:hypothetical protein